MFIYRHNKDPNLIAKLITAVINLRITTIKETRCNKVRWKQNGLL